MTSTPSSPTIRRVRISLGDEVLGELALDADRHSIALHPAPRKGRQLRRFMAGLRTCSWLYQKQSAAEFLEALLLRPARYWWAQDVTHEDASAG